MPVWALGSFLLATLTVKALVQEMIDGCSGDPQLWAVFEYVNAYTAEVAWAVFYDADHFDLDRSPAVATWVEVWNRERGELRDLGTLEGFAQALRQVQRQASWDDRLAYDRFRAMGLDIGSGRVEAACKHVVGARMKRCGMRWSPAGSQNTLSLRVTRLNGDWEAFWQKRPLARVA